MIPSLLLWLLMAGQGRAGNIVCGWPHGGDSPSHTITFSGSERDCVGTDEDCRDPKNWTSTSEAAPVFYDLPREHVIEIRTKREYSDFAANGKWPYTPTCPCGYEWNNVFNEGLACFRVTKTLWLDGTKIGVIREVEEK